MRIDSATYLLLIASTPTQAVDLPDSLLEAVVAFIEASATGPSFTGGITSGKAADTARVPYVVVKERASREELHTSDLVVHEVTLELRVYAEGEDAAGSLGDALTREIAADGGARFPFTDGSTSKSVRMGEPKHVHAGKSHSGRPLWYQEQAWRVRVFRAK